MTLDGLRRFELIYVATPYTKYPDGIEEAFIDASILMARLLERGLRVYSPIVHTHPIAIYGHMDPLDHNIWLPFDQSMMDKADALLVAKLETWEKSFGINHEIGIFAEANKPIYYLDPKLLEVS